MEKRSDKNKCEISLNEPNTHIYFPGDVIRGTVEISGKYCKRPLLILSLYGTSQVKFVVKIPPSRRQSCLVAETIKIFQIYRYLLINKDQYLYQFALKIPCKDEALPWSVKTQHGEVEYGIKCFLKGSYCSADFEIARKPFILKSYVNWNTITGVNGEYYGRACPQICKTLGYNLCTFPICCENPKIKLRLVDWKWYEPGEEVRFKIEFDNTRESEYVGKGIVRLVSKWRYSSFYGSDELNGVKLYSKAKNIWFVTNSADVRKHVKELGFVLPQNLMATQAESRILLWTHKLQVCIELMDEDEVIVPFKAEVDILVGF